MQFGESNSAVLQSDASDTFHLAPQPFAIQAAQPGQFADPTARRDGLDIGQVADKLEVHAGTIVRLRRLPPDDVRDTNRLRSFARKIRCQTDSQATYQRRCARDLHALRSGFARVFHNQGDHEPAAAVFDWATPPCFDA